MRIYKYLFFSVLLVFAACKGSENVPDGIISEERMPAIMADVHIIDGDMVTKIAQPDSLYKYGMGHYIALFKKHHTDTAQFRKSFLWYTKHPERLDTIYNHVIRILQKKNDSLAKIKVPGAPAVAPVKPANAVPAK